MHFHVETLLSEPVIAAVKTESALTAALASPCSTIFLLASTLVNVEGMVQRCRCCASSQQASLSERSVSRKPGDAAFFLAHS